ncbi:MAG TPA: ferredoxin family protein [Polyangiaceae bacterium]|nr:ferredoxin family protein [Polyangiaceae bacterium]
MSESNDRERIKAAQGKTVDRAQTTRRFDVPVVVDEKKCVTGCRICIDSCPVDCLAVDPRTQKSHMAFDECWYCLACELDCPKDAITVKIPFLLR